MRPPTHSDTTERQGHGTPRTVLLYPGDRGVGAVECRSVARALSNWRAALVCCWFGLVPSRCCDRNGTFAPTRWFLPRTTRYRHCATTNSPA